MHKAIILEHKFRRELPSWMVAFALGITACGAPLQAQTPRSVYLFNTSLGTGPLPSNTGIRPAAWGNGEARPTRRPVDYEGATPLEVTTRNFAEGARFDLQTPLDIVPYIPTGFVRLRLKFANAVNPTEGILNVPDVPEVPVPDFGGRRGRRNPNFLMRDPEAAQWTANAQFGAPGGTPRPGAPRAGNTPGGALPPIGGVPFPGTMPFPGVPGVPGFEGDPGVPVGPPAQATPIKQLKITFVRENGTMMGRIPVDLDATTPDANGWRLFTLPIREMSSTSQASGPVSRILLTADSEDTFFLAQAAVVVETGEMMVSVRLPDQPPGASIGEVTVKPGRVTLIADVEAGAADPVVEWNFDADNTGILPPPALNGPAPGVGPDGAPVAGFNGAGFGGAPLPTGAPTTPIGGLPGAINPETGQPVEGGFTGPRIDARGLTASFTYPNEEQNYRVEVTVRDQSGKKEPATASVLVRVRG